MTDEIQFQQLTTNEFAELWSRTRAPSFVRPDAPVPSIDDLIAYGAQATNVRWLAAIQSGALAAAIPFVVERRRVAGVWTTALCAAGTDFFDYTPLYCDRAVARRVVSELSVVARQGRADLTLVNNLVDPPEGLRSVLREIERTRVFNVRKDERLWRSIKSKRSMRYEHNRAKKNLRYNCVHLAGDFPPELLEQVAKLHTERWEFEGLPGPLEGASRRALYHALRDNAVLTVLWDADDIIAAHYGLKFGDAIIFHTPVVNIKYLSFSPIQLLLYEVASFCELHGISVLDYGLGDEAYKIRFTNEERPVFELLRPLTARGFLAQFLRERLTPFLRPVVDRLANSRRRMNTLQQNLRDPFVFYAGTCGTRDAASQSHPISGYTERSDFGDFVELARRCGLKPKRSHYERFKRRQVFACIIENDRISGACWIFGLPLSAGDGNLVLDFEQGGSSASLRLLTCVREKYPLCRPLMRIRRRYSPGSSEIRMADFKPASRAQRMQMLAVLDG